MSFRPFFGDCLEKMKLLPDKSVDLFLCDLPYGCLTGQAKEPKSYQRKRFIDGKDTGTILTSQVLGGCEWDIKIDLKQFWEQVERLAKNDHTPVIHFCNARFGFELYNSKPDWFRYDLVWSKTNAVGFLTANKKPMASHENIYVFSKKGAYYKRINIDSHCPTSIITVLSKKGKGNHPTQKSAEIYRWLIERYCPEGGTVLDPTAGSFTSVVTACEMGRHGIGMELNYDFFMKAFEQYKYLLIN